MNGILNGINKIIGEEAHMVLDLYEKAKDEGGNLISRMQDYMRCAGTAAQLAQHVLNLLKNLEEQAGK